MAQQTARHLNKCPSITTGLTEDCSCGKEVAHYLNLAKWSFGLFLFEVAAGLFSNSMALVSDAFHVLADGTENMINVFVSHLSREGWNEETVRKVGGVASGLLLLFMGFLIIHEGWERYHEPHEVKWFMTFLAAVGLGVNLRQKWLHNQALPEHRNNQHFWQSWHLWSDIFASVAVIVGGIIMLISNDLYWIDGALSVAIGVWIVILVTAKLCGFEIHSHDHDHQHEHHNGHKCDHKH